MKKKKVFISTPVKIELPTKYNAYFTYTEEDFEGTKYPQSLGAEMFDPVSKKLIKNNK